MSAPLHRHTPALTGNGFTHAVTCGSPYRYLAAVPDDGAGPWPLLLFLHGSEERGRELDRVLRHGPPRLLAEGRRFPFVVVAPQCPCGRSWSAAKLEMLLDQVEATWPIDTRRIWATGLSMGGYGAWALALRCPGRLAALAPICGGGDVRQAHVLRALSIWAFHGALDDSVPPRESRKMVEAVNRAGGKARLTVYPAMGHDCWTHTYARPGLWKWLTAQRARA